MQSRYLKQIVVNKTHKGSNNAKTPYRITKPESYKTLIANRKHKLEIRDNNNGIDKPTLEHIKSVWTSRGYSLSDFNKLGVVKCIGVLNNG